MNLLALRLYRFGSFTDEQEFRFPQMHGLFFMQGENRKEPRLGPNGSGKTTLWSALYWLLFGKTPRGLKAGDVANWEEGAGCWVELDFSTIMGEECTVRRSWSPNSWTMRWTGVPESVAPAIDLTKDETNPVLGWLCLNADSFLNCVLMAQGQPMFLDQETAKKAEIFSSIMGLNKWLDFSSRASAKASEQDKAIREHDRTLHALRGRLQATQQSNLLERAAETWDRDRERRLNRLEEEHRERCFLLERIQADYAKQKEAVEICRGVYQKDSELEKNIKEGEAADAQKAQRLKEALAVAETRRDDAKASDGDRCKTCRQVLPGAGTRGAANHADHLKRLEQEARRAFAQWQEAQSKANHQKSRLEAARAAADDSHRLLQGAEALLRQLAAAELKETQEIDRLEVEAERLEAEKNPHAAASAESRQERQRLEGELRQAESRMEEMEQRYAKLSFWVRGFKEVRLQEITAGLSQLEVEANNELESLGLAGWDLLFDVDRETKGGSIQRGFAVRVRSPHNPRAVPWEAWSGGESQRLRLGAQMGLSNVTRQQTGTPLALEVWDEPTQWMSPQGVTDLLDALGRRAQREKRQIWIVDHRSLGYGNWSGTCLVVKTDKGSRFIQE